MSEISSCSSSLRYKSNVAPYLGGLDIINRLRPISFTWKQDGKKDIGIGAEEVEKIEPLLTFRNEKGEIEGVKYNQLSAVFINAFKEQQAQLNERERQASRQQYQLEQYRQQLVRQQTQLAMQQSEIVALRQLLCRHYPKAAVCKAPKLKKLQPQRFYVHKLDTLSTADRVMK